MPISDAVPMILSGWHAAAGDKAYQGTLTRDGEVIIAAPTVPMNQSWNETLKPLSRYSLALRRIMGICFPSQPPGSFLHFYSSHCSQAAAYSAFPAFRRLQHYQRRRRSLHRFRPLLHFLPQLPSRLCGGYCTAF